MELFVSYQDILKGYRIKVCMGYTPKCNTIFEMLEKKNRKKATMMQIMDFEIRISKKTNPNKIVIN